MERDRIAAIAQNPEDRLLLAKLWDKIHAGIRRNIPAWTCFLSPREQALAQSLLGPTPGLQLVGGYPEAERRLLLYLPDYLETDVFLEEDPSPLWCLHAAFYAGDALSHKDLLGALMGLGIARETVGDICVGSGSCDFFVSGEIAPYVLQNLTGAGRSRLQLTRVPLSGVLPAQPQTREIRDTVASLRFDSILAAGFRIGRSAACEHIAAGRAAIDGLPCEKPDRPVSEGMKLSVRGLGKIRLTKINGQTKKGRISVIIHQYI